MPRIKVQGHATIGNLAAGYGTLAACVDIVALDLLGGLTDEGKIVIDTSSKDDQLDRTLRDDLIVEAIEAYLRHVDKADQGVSISVMRYLHGNRGLGTSAASVSAALTLINHLLKRPLSERELLPIAMDVLPEGVIQPHAHRLAASLYGGVQCMSNVVSGDSLRIRADLGLHLTVLCVQEPKSVSVDYPLPEIDVSTASKQLGYLAGLILGLERNHLPLIKDSLIDLWVEDTYKFEQPHFDALKSLAMDGGALGCSISGNGPSMWALSQNSFIAEEIALAWKRHVTSHDAPATVHMSGLNLGGAIVC